MLKYLVAFFAGFVFCVICLVNQKVDGAWESFSLLVLGGLVTAGGYMVYERMRD